MKKFVTVFIVAVVLVSGVIIGLRAVNSSPKEQSTLEPSFKMGTWMSYDEEKGQYYFFEKDGKTGTTASLENGMGLGFTYEKNEDKTVFHMGSDDMISSATVKVIDEDNIKFEWEDGTTESLSFVSDLDSKHFHFYSNEELQELALDYYLTRNSIEEHNFMTGALSNEDGTVTIQIYENLSDHNSTAAWYEVDRVTGEGKDTITDTPIDLTRGTSDIDIVSLDASKPKLPKDYYEYVNEKSEYNSSILLSAIVPVKNLKVVSLEYTEDDKFEILKELFSIENMTSEKPLLLKEELSSTIPNLGVIYTERNGKIKEYTISESGLDGTVMLLDGSFTSIK